MSFTNIIRTYAQHIKGWSFVETLSDEDILFEVGEAADGSEAIRNFTSYAKLHEDFLG